MTVNKIIKDLNFYRGQKLFEFNGKKPEIYIHDIIDIINLQKAEIERLRKQVNLVSIQFQDLQERYEEAQAEIERLKPFEDKKEMVGDSNE